MATVACVSAGARVSHPQRAEEPESVQDNFNAGLSGERAAAGTGTLRSNCAQLRQRAQRVGHKFFERVVGQNGNGSGAVPDCGTETATCSSDGARVSHAQQQRLHWGHAGENTRRFAKAGVLRLGQPRSVQAANNSGNALNGSGVNSLNDSSGRIFILPSKLL